VRTTINLADDVAAAVEHLRRERDVGLSEAVNELARKGLTVKKERKRFVQRTAPVGVKIDVTCLGEVLAKLDEDEYDADVG
jgi:hypothetical protein